MIICKKKACEWELGIGSAPDWNRARYRRMRFSGPLYEHAAWDRTERALAFPTGRAFQLEARASGPGRWLASEVIASGQSVFKKMFSWRQVGN